MLFEDEEIPQITAEQISEAINNLLNGTAPGYDGLSGEHFNQQALNCYLSKLFQYLIEQGSVLSSWKIGIITFLPKPGKPNEAYASTKAWRRITILPTINKIIGKTIMDGVKDDIQAQLS